MCKYTEKIDNKLNILNIIKTTITSLRPSVPASDRQSVSQSVTQSRCPSLRQFDRFLVSSSANQSVNRSVRQPVSLSAS